MLDQREVASDPGPADLGFASKGRHEYTRIRQNSIHGGCTECGPCVKRLFLL